MTAQRSSGFEVTFSPSSAISGYSDIVEMYGTTEYGPPTAVTFNMNEDITHLKICSDLPPSLVGTSAHNDFEGFEFTESVGTV